MPHNRTIALLMITLALLPLAGCTGSDGRQSVSGEVTLDGRPMDTGSISFRPAPDNKANSAGVTIKDGKYSLPAESGLKPGKYIVTIQAFRATGRMNNDPQMGLVPVREVVKCHEAGSLEAVVEAGEKNNFDFTLTSVP